LAEDLRLEMTAVPQRRQGTVLPGERLPTSADAQPLAALMLEAYRGTVDDHGQDLSYTFREMRRMFANQYGPFLPHCSRVVEREARIVCATLLTRWQGRPFLLYTMTAPDCKRQGLARASLVNAMNAVLDHEGTALGLIVTPGNTGARALYESLGFTPDR
jgi:GNAT superfamily N-acetyltransferase